MELNSGEPTPEERNQATLAGWILYDSSVEERSSANRYSSIMTPEEQERQLALWSRFNIIYRQHEVVPGLLKTASEFTGQMREIDDTDEDLNLLDANLVFSSVTSAGLLGGRFEEFANDDDETLLKDLFSLKGDDLIEELIGDSNDWSQRNEIDEEVETFELYCYAHFSVLVEAVERLGNLNSGQITGFGINRNQLKDWLYCARTFLSTSLLEKTLHTEEAA